VRATFGAGLGVVLDGGQCDGVPSTVVSILYGELTLLRQGAIPFEDLRSVFRTAIGSE
jgi:tRNA A37 threonylcarbamoyladenosine synthetase subunit TsaC/SUA5/YrdC